LKKFTLFLLGLVLAGSLVAQDFPAATRSASARKRCGTMEAIARKRLNPAIMADWMARRNSVAPERTSTLTTTVTIPVVIHVVLPNPNIITEDQVDYLINRLNSDFSGLNPDSTNAGTAFTPLRGHSLIRFARARRTPAGLATTGIERRNGQVEIEGDTYQPLKHSSDGGLDPWDITKYYNIWVGFSSAGILGIAPGISQGNQTETTTSPVGIDGICVDYTVFSNGCFSDAAFNLGRTAVHEIGHNFGLYHIFSGCYTGADFEQTENGDLPASMVGNNDDTPDQDNSTSGCLSGIVASDCGSAPNPPGKMYQNYMDYTDDACYSMFTKKQVERMHYILEVYRPGYLTTQGHIPPGATTPLDASPTLFLSPGAIEFNNTSCGLTTYAQPICPGNVTPRVQITNFGTATITSIIVTSQVNSNTPVASAALPVNIAPGGTAIVSAPTVVLVAGTNTLKVTTSAPNGGADGTTSNDALTKVIYMGPSAAPVTEGFEGGTFPSTNFNIYNPHNDSTWRKAAPGRTGSFSMMMNNYDNSNYNSLDEFRSVPVTLAAGADSLVISFDLAHKYYNDVTAYDTLSVLYTTNCGTTYTMPYQKAGPTLATAGTSNNRYTTPIAADWRTERIAISGVTGTAEVIFRNKTRYGNNIFIDNINIQSTCKSTTINTQPAATQTVCVNAPATFTVAATGSGVTYQWFKGVTPIATATSATYTIPLAAMTDAGSFYVNVTNACGVTTRSNDAVLIVSNTGACATTAVSNLNPDVHGIILMPNAVRNNATLRVQVARAMKIEWKVIDAQGRIVKRFSQQAVSGQNDVNFEATSLARGPYQLVGDTNKGKTTTLKFVRL
jgi:hypothetical protein